MIIGLGKISYLYRLRSELVSQSEIETHFFVAQELGFNVICGVDNSLERRRDFSKYCNTRALGDIREGLTFNPDVIVIAASSESHEDIVQKLLEFGASCDAIILEKPLGLNYRQTQSIVLGAQRIANRVYINYTREFSSGRSLIEAKMKERPRKSVTIYGRDLRQNGCHYLRLALGLHIPFSSLPKVQILEKHPLRPSFKVNFGDQDAFFISNDYEFRDYRSVFFCDKSILEVKNESFEISIDGKLDTSGDLRRGLRQIYLEILNPILSQEKITSHLYLAEMTSLIADKALGT